MKKLDIGKGSVNIEYREEQPRPMSSNKAEVGCSSLDFNNLAASQEAKLIYLFDILIEAYIEIKKNELNKQRKL